MKYNILTGEEKTTFWWSLLEFKQYYIGLKAQIENVLEWLYLAHDTPPHDVDDDDDGWLLDAWLTGVSD